MSLLTKFTTELRFYLLIQAYKHWLHKRENVLDVGCGDGIMTSLLIKNLNIQTTGCDIQNYLKVNIPFSQMISETILPFKKNSFDCVMLNDVLHHMSFDKQELLIQECLRIAPKVLIFEDEPTLVGKSADFLINKFHNFTMPVPLTFRSNQQWKNLFKKLDIDYTFKKINQPLFYPFNHQAFLLKK